MTRAACSASDARATSGWRHRRSHVTLARLPVLRFSPRISPRISSMIRRRSHWVCIISRVSTLFSLSVNLMKCCLCLIEYDGHQCLFSFLQVRRDCGGEFEKNKIPMPECSMIYPEDDDPKNKGLCHLTAFPVAWPVKRVEGMRVAWALQG